MARLPFGQRAGCERASARAGLPHVLRAGPLTFSSAVIASGAGYLATALSGAEPSTSGVPWGCRSIWGRRCVMDILSAVSAVLGAISLALAFVIFLRDRRNGERAQVDLVGAWASVEYQPRAPWDTEQVGDGEVTAHLRNASQLPVRLVRIAYKVESRWMVEDKAQSRRPDGPGIWMQEPGTQSRRFFNDNLRIPPQETIELQFKAGVADMAPAGASQLAVERGIEASVEWMLLLDNAGRRWEVRPEKNGRARRVGSGWKPEEYMPREW